MIRATGDIVIDGFVKSAVIESGAHIQRVKSFTRELAMELARQYPEYELSQKKIEKIATELRDAED